LAGPVLGLVKKAKDLFTGGGMIKLWVAFVGRVITLFPENSLIKVEVLRIVGARPQVGVSGRILNSKISVPNNLTLSITDADMFEQFVSGKTKNGNEWYICIEAQVGLPVGGLKDEFNAIFHFPEKEGEATKLHRLNNFSESMLELLLLGWRQIRKLWSPGK
jgi:hypothetical protein